MEEITTAPMAPRDDAFASDCFAMLAMRSIAVVVRSETTAKGITPSPLSPPLKGGEVKNPFPLDGGRLGWG